MLTPDFTILHTSRRQILLEFKKKEVTHVYNVTKGNKFVCNAKLFQMPVVNYPTTVFKLLFLFMIAGV